jgi:hypothetical protein
VKSALRDLLDDLAADRRDRVEVLADALPVDVVELRELREREPRPLRLGSGGGRGRRGRGGSVRRGLFAHPLHLLVGVARLRLRLAQRRLEPLDLLAQRLLLALGGRLRRERRVRLALHVEDGLVRLRRARPPAHRDPQDEPESAERRCRTAACHRQRSCREVSSRRRRARPGGRRPDSVERERHERETPRASVAAVRAVEPAAQLLDAAADPRPRRLQRHARPLRDLARRKVVEEPQEQRRAVRLLEREHRLHDEPVLLGARHDLGRGRLRLRPRVRRFARDAAALAAPHLPRRVANGRREPRGQGHRVTRRRAQRRGHRVLHHVVGLRVVADQAARETPHPARVGEERFGSGRARGHRGKDAARPESGA